MWRTLFCAAVGLTLLANGMAEGQHRFTGKSNQTPQVQGKVRYVLPQVNTVVVRVGQGGQALDIGYNVDKNTKMWGANGQPINNGLNYQGFKHGNQVMINSQPGQSQNLVGELRFFNPSAPSGSGQ